MRLDFNALWIDDQERAIASIREAFERSIREEGFQLQVNLKKSVAEARRSLGDSVMTDDIDLVLIDYDLGRGSGGELALREIRDQLPYKEIIFYSAKPTAELRKLAFDQGVEGVYCAGRGDLVDTAQRVFETLIKKVLDIDQTRGIVMGATSDIDHTVHDILLVVHRKLGKAEQSKMLSRVLAGIEKKIATFRKKADEAKQAGDIEYPFRLYDLVTAADKLAILAEQLKSGKMIKDATLRQKIRKYQFEIVPRRNIVAHVKMEITPNGRVLRAADGKELTASELKELRRELLEHRENFRQLAAALSK